MNLGKTLFAQVMDLTFHRIAQRHNADHRMRTLSCVEQFRVMAFAQLTYRESLRDIEAWTQPVARSTLADVWEANCQSSRDWCIE